MNLILLQGVIQNTWTLRNALYARLVHYDENGQPGYYTLVFDGNVLVRETNNGDATQRVVARNRCWASPNPQILYVCFGNPPSNILTDSSSLRVLPSLFFHARRPFV